MLLGTWTAMMSAFRSRIVSATISHRALLSGTSGCDSAISVSLAKNRSILVFARNQNISSTENSEAFQKNDLPTEWAG
jgi:hypothetical protein